MPTLPEGAKWDLEAPGSRFALRPALGLSTPEGEWPRDGASDDEWEDTVRRNYGDWLLDEEDPTLGTATLVRAEARRGASFELAVIWWVLEPVVRGVITWAGVEAVKRAWRRARSGDDENGEAKPRSVLVNRGTAILLAADAVKETFGEEDELVLEAAEEPSAIAGRPMTEPSYVGLEPWVVLLRSQDARTRYVVVVEAHGDILSCSATPMNESESLFFDPTRE
jgi:hypothetical protein